MLEAMQLTRQCHSTALLLPDGRVLSSGGGICGTCDSVGYLAKNAEVFSAPYLFKKDGSGELAPRPEVTPAPDEVNHNTQFAITTPNAASIGKVALVRLGAVTHSVNMEQRYVPLSFTAGAGAINATAPANANVAPPGIYMLFVIGAEGVPSVARMVRVTSPAAPPPNQAPSVSITSPPEGASFAWHPDITIAANSTDSDGTVQKVEFFRDNGAVKIGEDTTAPYSVRWRNANAGNYTVTAKATDNAGAATTSAPVHITVRPKH